MKRWIAVLGIGIVGAGAGLCVMAGLRGAALTVTTGLIIAVGGSYAAGWEDADRFFRGLLNMVKRG